MFKDIDLTVFPTERKEKLENIYRYSYFDTLLYRSNLWMHSYRVLWLLEEVVPLAQKHFEFDVEKARVYALVHDDAEMITGDVQAILKSHMTKEEQEKHDNDEEAAIRQLAETYPKEVNGYSYEALLRHAARKDCIEAQLVSFIDKVDAYCETLHEIYAGNISLLRSAIFYARTTASFPEKYPLLKSFLSSKESPFSYLQDQISPYEIKAENYTSLLKPHTIESLKINSDFPFYREWKRIVVERGKIEWLINQREFLSPLSN